MLGLRSRQWLRFCRRDLGRGVVVHCPRSAPPAAIVARVFLRPVPKGFQGDVFPHAYRLIWLVLITQNVIAQLVTGPPTAWNEMVFSIYYVLLFLITAVILLHFDFVKRAVPVSVTQSAKP
jgi:hypothetical protein